MAALASSAELLILDEPTSGLDPLMESVFQDCIREARAEGRTVLLSSHILAEVEALCDRVTIIRSGRSVETGTLDELRRLSRTRVSAHVRRPTDRLQALPGVRDVQWDGSRISFTVDRDGLEPAVRILADHGLRELTSQPPTLEELFLGQYGEVPARNAAAPPGTPPTGSVTR